jgi:hypothetical protein
MPPSSVVAACGVLVLSAPGARADMGRVMASPVMLMLGSALTGAPDASESDPPGDANCEPGADPDAPLLRICSEVMAAK